eukprot:GHVR01108136.1.p1 GENE.GHVR01108136.1~~GHVR01108136.1.p1  ORF type:complete len:109 (-),score=6.49 GHVR01108136.1:248-574(-)
MERHNKEQLTESQPQSQVKIWSVSPLWIIISILVTLVLCGGLYLVVTLQTNGQNNIIVVCCCLDKYIFQFVFIQHIVCAFGSARVSTYVRSGNYVYYIVFLSLQQNRE